MTRGEVGISVEGLWGQGGWKRGHRTLKGTHHIKGRVKQRSSLKRRLRRRIVKFPALDSSRAPQPHDGTTQYLSPAPRPFRTDECQTQGGRLAERGRSAAERGSGLEKTLEVAGNDHSSE